MLLLVSHDYLIAWTWYVNVRCRVPMWSRYHWRLTVMWSELLMYMWSIHLVLNVQ